MGEKNLKTKVFNSVVWKALERVCAQLVSTLVAIALARILMPEDYSVVSIATIFFAFCNLIISNGLNTALIQKKDADALDYSTIFVANMVFSCVLYAVMFFCAPAIARLYNKPIVVPIIRVMGLTFFINGYKAVLCAKISSDMQFRKFFFSTIIGTLISAVVGIFMAYHGFGAWALVAQQMTNSAIDSLFLTATTKITFGFRFSFDRFKGLFVFGGKILLASVLTTIYDECKPLIVGIKFSTADLAFYNKGMSFPNLVNSIGNNTLSSALFPAMSKVQDDKKTVLSMTRRFMKLSSFVVLPMMAGLIAVSENFVKVVLTDKWLPIVPFLMIFCVSYAFDLVQIGNLQAIKALGRSDYILIMEIIKKVSYFIIIALFVLFSENATVLALSGIICAIVATLVNTYPNRTLIGYSYIYQIMDILPNFLTSAVMCVAVFLMNRIHINTFHLLILQVVSGIAIYIVLNLIIKNENLYYLLDMIKSKLKKEKSK